MALIDIPKATRKNKSPDSRLALPSLKFHTNLYDLLWLDRKPTKVKIAKNNTDFLNGALRQIMFKLGADAALLETKCFAICGPTAVGKTKFINNLKEKFHVETINMDTMQVYHGISYGTGRTNLATTKGSYIYGTYDPKTEFHIIDYLIDVIAAMKTINANGNVAVFEGASKSLLRVLIRVFPNLVVFGIKAVSKQNVVDNITKRLTNDIIKKAILELADALKQKVVKVDSSVLVDNWPVYSLIVSTYRKKTLLDSKLASILDSDDTRLTTLTKQIVAANVNLHFMQLKSLQKFADVIWFNNDVGSVKKLEAKFLQMSKHS